MDSIVWLDQNVVKSACPDIDHWSMDFVWLGIPAFMGVNFWIDRAQVSNNHSTVKVLERFHMPEVQKTSVVTFEQATESRVQYFADFLEHNPETDLMLCWSGGIDSTCALVAMQMHLDPRLMSRVKVGLSGASIYENPYFFRDHVVGKFSIIDLEHDLVDRTRLLSISGGCGDKITDNELLIKWALDNPGDQAIDKNIRRLERWLSNYTGNRLQSRIVIQRTLDSARQNHYEVLTVADFIFWLGFNFGWVGQMCNKWSDSKQSPDPSDVTLGLSLSWYDSVEYQTWARQRSSRWNSGREFHQEYKKDFKDYIYDFDKNVWFKNFSQKFPSVVKLQRNGDINNWNRLAVFESGRSILINPKTLKQDIKDLGWI